MTIKTELLKLQKSAKGGLLHADAVVNWAASHPKSAIHKSLTWDDATAAHAYRIWQVRELIHMHIVSDIGAPMMVSLSYDRAQGGGYRAIDDVLQSRDLSEIMLNDALAELKRVQTRYARVKELTSVWTAVAKVAKKKGKK